MKNYCTAGQATDDMAHAQWRTEGGFGGSNPRRSSEDICGVLDRMSKKNRRLDFLL